MTGRRNRVLEASKIPMTDSRFKGRTLLVPVISCVGLLVLALVLISPVVNFDPEVETVAIQIDPIAVFPDFANIPDVDVKKQQFFDFLADYIDAENAELTAAREELLAYAEIANSGAALSRNERNRVLEIARVYELDSDLITDLRLINTLLQRVDVIPASLALAQAATESAWGTSRFTLEGNNIFGQWCYEEGCGIVPERRLGGAVHEVKRFDSVESSVAAYFLNINSHQYYQDFRELRAQMRRQQKKLDSMELSYALGRYSERGESYVVEVQTIIEQNNLKLRDKG